MNRRERLAEFLEENTRSIESMDGVSSERYLLVERSRFDSSLFLATFASPEDAGIYHDTQEEPDDWPIWQLIDLDTGDVIPHETRTVTTFDQEGPAAATCG